MPDLNALVKGAVDAGVNEAFRRANQDWQQQAQALGQLGGQAPTPDQLAGILKTGYVPDTFLGARLQIGVELTVDATQEQTIGANGGVQVGPVQISGNYARKDTQGSQTNVSINIEMERQSRNAGLEYVVAQLTQPGVPTIPVPTVSPTGAPAAPGSVTPHA